MHNALSRGEELSHNLEGLKDQLARAVKLGKSTTSALHTTNANSNTASSANAANSTSAQGVTVNGAIAAEDGQHGDTASVLTGSGSKRVVR